MAKSKEKAKLKLRAEIIKLLEAQKGEPVTFRGIGALAGVGRARKGMLHFIVNELMREGRLVESSGKLVLSEHLNLVPAEISRVAGTFGFAKLSDGQEVFIRGKKLGGAMPGDGVLLSVRQGEGDLPEGSVARVTSEARGSLTGVFMRKRGRDFVFCEQLGIELRVAEGKTGGAADGDKVIARVIKRATRHSDHICEVAATFGSSESASACCEAIIAAAGIMRDFPPDAREQAAKAAQRGIPPEELDSRLDLRAEPIFTIDGADSKDLDDAVSLRETETGWELGVHIADVGWYVPHRSPLDEEAFLRGTSVYFADSVVPMLPKELSNGICSLNPAEDRLAFSAMLELDARGKLAGYSFEKTVIRSRVKGVYHEVNAILAGTAGDEIHEKYKEVEPEILRMAKLADILGENRRNRGSVNLGSSESKIVLDKNGVAIDVVPRVQGAAEHLIEEFMLLANEAAAREGLKYRLPYLFRVHEDPAEDKLNTLGESLAALGVDFGKSGAAAVRLNAALAAVRGTPVENVASMLVLRSMAKARYAARHIGHFGLALADYTHFTSPIRRYPDLFVHRVLAAHLSGEPREKIEARYGSFAVQAAVCSSESEQAATNAERLCESCYKAEFMHGRLGSEFDGTVSQANQSGFFVALPNTVEGFCRLEGLPGTGWMFDGGLAVVNSITGERFRMGDSVRIRVLAASVSTGRIDFEPVHSGPPARQQ